YDRCIGEGGPCLRFQRSGAHGGVGAHHYCEIRCPHIEHWRSCAERSREGAQSYPASRGVDAVGALGGLLLGGASHVLIVAEGGATHAISREQSRRDLRGSAGVGSVELQQTGSDQGSVAETTYGSDLPER